MKRPPKRSPQFRKAFGQHFLKDPNVIEKIVNRFTSALPNTSAQVLEIGPGGGALTERLLSENLQMPLVLCERDRELAEQWRQRLSPPNQVLEGDFLDLDESQWLKPHTAVISNLPYASGTAILNRLAAHPEQVLLMMLMFQKEVAERLRASPKSKAWGSLSLWIQNQWDVASIAHVPPGAFRPPPKVQSEVVLLTPRTTPRIAGSTTTPDAQALFQSLLRAAFAHRRKMLRAGLRHDPLGPRLQNALERSGLNDMNRAESLSWEDWGKWFGALAQDKA